MVVRKNQRRKGIGKIMLQDVLHWAKEKGVTRKTFINTGACPQFESGFELGTSRSFYTR